MGQTAATVTEYPSHLLNAKPQVSREGWPHGDKFAQVIWHGSGPENAEWIGPKDWATFVTRDLLQSVTPLGEYFGKHLHKLFPWPMKIVALHAEIPSAFILVRTDA